MWLTMIMNFAGSKTGKIVIAGLIILALIGGYKLKISSLERQIDRLRAEKADVAIRNKICQADLGALLISVDNQNAHVEELERLNNELNTAAVEAASSAISTPEEIDAAIEGVGPEVLNNFYKEVYDEE